MGSEAEAYGRNNTNASRIMGNSNEEVWELTDQGCHVALTHNLLNIQEVMDRVRSPAAGAIVLFAGEDNITPRKDCPLADPCLRDDKG